MSRLVLRLALIVGVAALAAAPASARITFEVSPSLLELNAKPGAEGVQELTVTNAGDEPMEAAVTVKPVRGTTEKTSAVDWLSVDPESFRLDPGGQQIITVKIHVPDGLESGGRYALVAVTAQAARSVDDQGKGNRATLAGEIGVGFMIVVDGKGKLIRKASVERFAPVLDFDGRVGFRALLRNQGNVHLLDVSGSVDVKDAKGKKKLASLEFKPGTPLLPGVERLLETQGTLPLSPGERYRSSAVIYLSGDKDGSKVKAEAEFAVAASLELHAGTACENFDGGPTLEVLLQNESDLGVLPRGTITIKSEGGATVASAPLGNNQVAWPKSTTPISVTLEDRLESGRYVASVDAAFGRGQTAHVDIPFQIGGVDGTPLPLCES